MKNQVLRLSIQTDCNKNQSVVAQEVSASNDVNAVTQFFTFRIYKADSNKIYSVIAEQIFDASCYNMATRNNVNIRDIANSFIKEFQYDLRKKPAKTQFFGYDTVKYLKTVTKKDETSFLDDNSNDFKIGLYINNINKDSDKKEHIIIERDFTVEGYYPENRTTASWYYLMVDFTNEIKKRLLEKDKLFTYDNCAILYNFPTMDIDRINKMTLEDRASILRKIGL